MEKLLDKSDALVSRVELVFKRYLYSIINWDNRLIGIKGARGTGKTTMMLQRLNEMGKSATEAAYFSLDDLYFSNHLVTDTAEKFYKQGGKYLFIDEVHKYPGWAREIKNLYDNFPDLKIVFTGSSIIDISKLEGDLSRRALMHELHGFSYREFLEYGKSIQLPVFSINQMVESSSTLRQQFSIDWRPLQYFKEYLSYGYYPFFKEDITGYHQRLQQLIRLIVEYDMAELQGFDIRNSKKILQLLYILAENVPFKPNLSKLADKSSIHRNSLISYLGYLEQARLIRLLYPSGISVAILQKPEKIYLNNTNLAYALAIEQPDSGSLRETFFQNQLSVLHRLNYPSKGDFLVDNKWTFEVGGKGKGNIQIKGLPDAYVVKDDIDFPIGKSIPLWLFGFLY